MVERASPEDELRADVRLLGGLLGETIQEVSGEGALALVDGLRTAAISLRRGTLPGGREELARRMEASDLSSLEEIARAFTRWFHLMNSAEEQHRVRVLRRRDRGTPLDGSIRAAFAELRRSGTTADDVRVLLSRLLVMPVLTAHPTEARRRTVLDHLATVSGTLDRLDDPRTGARARELSVAELREAVLALSLSEEARATRPTPAEEVRAGLDVFERALLPVTPAIYRELEDALAGEFPGEPFVVGPFLRWGTWIGGDRDGNPHVTAEVTRSALEQQRALALARHRVDVDGLVRELSVSSRRAPASLDGELRESLEEDRARLPEVAARLRPRTSLEPLREKLGYMAARLDATRAREEASYPDARAYLEELRLLERSLAASGLERLARGALRDARRRAEVFGFHLATLDLRQHALVHEGAVAELLARGGKPGYLDLPESGRAALLARLLERADVGAVGERSDLSPASREILATLDVIARARRDQGPAACERYVVSFTRQASDLLEVLFLARAAGLAPDELRPVPLLEQLEDLERAGELASTLLEIAPLRVAFKGELEVMIGYSDSGKQAGYVASAVALRRAQEALARAASARGVVLTVFHGRGGAIGRGGGPANRTIQAQPPGALRGRLRETEQGETIAVRFARREIARRDLEQMIHAVLVSWGKPDEPPGVATDREAVLDVAARAARAAYSQLVSDEERLAAYALTATPLEEVAALPIASRPAARGRALRFADLRAIPWVFSWNQSRHGISGWFGLGSALSAIAETFGPERARQLYQDFPFFRALLDNAQLALVRADIDVAEHYSRLAPPSAKAIFELIRAEHARTVARVLEATGERELLEQRPTIARTVKLRNPYVDVLNHAQIELMRRLRSATTEAERERIHEALFVTINGIAAGLQTAG